MAFPGVGRPESYTDVCGIYSPTRHTPPHKPTVNERHPKNSQYHCPRCGSSGSRLSNLSQHFPACIKTNGNTNSLRWFDGDAGTPEQNPIQATVLISKDTPSRFGLTSSLEDEPGAKIAMSKVDRWAAMAKKYLASSGLPSKNMQGAGSPILHSPTATLSTTDKSSLSDTPVVKRPVLKLNVTPKPRVRFASPPARDEPITPLSVKSQPRTPPERKKPRIGHTENTAHLFNNAGFLVPSIPGIDSVTERLFDKGEIMSLRPPRSHDGYYPDGEPVGGSFLMENWHAKKRKRDDEN